MFTSVTNDSIPRCLLRWVSFLLTFSAACYSQTVPSSYQVGTWKGFRSAAITYTFDDNCSNQLALAVPMFNQLNFNLTLFTVINWGPNWTGLQAAEAKGHEIASHTMSHTSLGTLSDSLQLIELKNSQSTIEAHILGQKCETIAYPNCVTGNSSLVSQYYIAARGCQGYIEGKTPRDYMNISSIICGALGSVKTSADFKANADNAARSNGWCVYLIHGIDNDGGYSPLPSDTLRASLQYLSANPDKFWVSTFGNVVKYISERNSVSVSELSNQGDSITVQVTDPLDSTYYDTPITIRRQVPNSWDSAVVMQEGVNISSKTFSIDTVKYVMFDVVPNGGDITILKRNATGIEQQSGFAPPSSIELHQNYPNPFNPSTVISYRLSANSIVTLKVYDVLGRQAATLFDGRQNAGHYNVTFDAANLPSGVYFYRILAESFGQAGSYSEIRKLVLLK